MTTTATESKSLTEALRGKVVVVDTSSLLMVGTGLLSVLEDCEIVVPAVVVRELEDKRSHPTIGFLSRRWIRLLEEIRASRGIGLAHGVRIDEGENITVRVEPNHRNQASLPEHLQDGSHDSTVLAVAKNLMKDGKDVVLLSNDTPMRLHSTLDLDIPAFEFNAMQVIGARPFDGRYVVTLSQEECSNKGVYGDPEDLYKIEDYILDSLPEDRSENAYVAVVMEGDTRHLYDLLVIGDEIVPVHHKVKASGITGKTTEQDVAMSWLRTPADVIPIVSLGGSAGTGKTLVTMAVAFEELKRKSYDKIMVFRSLHELGQGQEIGFLPGDVNDKMAAWSGAVFDAIDVIASKSRKAKSETSRDAEVKRLREMVEIAPITFLRGRSLANTFIILEEAQNFSRSEILNILSRAGVGSKIVLTFDAAQVDNRFLQSGKNADIWSVVDSLKDSELFAHVTLQKTERSQVAELASGLLENQR